MGARKIQEEADKNISELRKRHKAGLEKTDLYVVKVDNLKRIKKMAFKDIKNAKKPKKSLLKRII